MLGIIGCDVKAAIERLGDPDARNASLEQSLAVDASALQTYMRDMAASPQPLLVRSYQPADRESLEALWHRVFPDDPPWNAPALMIETKLRVQPELLLVGEQGARIAGAVIAGFDGVRGWIYHLAVAPQLRRRGFATQLVRAAEHGLCKLGCAKVNLQVRTTNHQVVAFYRSLGYTIEERVSMGRRLEEAG